LTQDEPPAVDLVLVGDLFYDEALAARVTAFLDRCRAAGIAALVGDPWRAPLRREQLRLLREYSVPDFGESGMMKPAGVFEFVRAVTASSQADGSAEQSIP
jgi:predicted nicotinamide N-methyase